jgi:hypothetical protein
MFKNRAQGYKAKEQRLLEESIKRTFTGWNADDWKRFEESFQKTM